MAETKSKLSDEWGAFTGIPNEFIDHSKDLSDQARWLFVLLRRYTNGETGKAFPSYKTITDKTGWIPRTIAKAIRQLEEAGWMTREKQFGGNAHYILRRPSQYVQSELTGAHSKFRENAQYVPMERTVSSYGTQNKIEDKKKEGNKTPPPPATSIDDLGTALEDAYPGHANNFKTMRELYDLCKRIGANSIHVAGFAAWLSERYPTKANGPFAFKDLFPEFVKSAPSVNGNGNDAAKTAAADRCRNCGGAGKSVRPGPDRFKPGQLLEPCPVCNGAGTTTTGAHHVSNGNRNRVTA